MNNLMRCLTHKQISVRNWYGKYLKVLPPCRYQSTQQSEAELLAQTLEDDIRKCEPRIVNRKPAIKPFLKEIFCGRFNTDVLAFPEFLNKSELESLANQVENLTKYTSNKNHSDKDVINYLIRTGIFGAPATAKHGGLAALATERCRIMEVLANRYDVAISTLDQWAGIDCLKSSLTEEELDETLPQLVSGEYNINIILAEPEACFPEMPDIRCKAKSTLNSGWVLDGEKIFMHKDLKNRYFVILAAVTKDVSEPFLVQPNLNTVTLEHPCVKFKNTDARVLGREFGDFDKTKTTYKLLQDALNNKRLGVAAACLGLLKYAVEETVQCTREKYINGLSISELPLYQDRIAIASLNAHAIESMIYLTCGLYDNYEDPDIDVEAIICKTYATQKTLDSIIGLLACVEAHNITPELNKCLDIAKRLHTENEVNDKINVYAMLSGLQYVSHLYAGDVKKLRNVLQYPMFVVKKMFENRNKDEETSDLNLRLEEFLHPSIQTGAENMEYCVMRLKYCNELLLSRHSVEILFEHRNLHRLAMITSSLFASIASLSRASRSYCIGLYLSEFEINASKYITLLSKYNIKRLSTDIDDDIYLNGDAIQTDVGERIFKHGKICFEHCLEKVYF